MRSHSQKNKDLPKLFEAQNYQEAIQILGARKAPGIFNKYIDTAFKIKDDTGKVRENMLREAETHLLEHEKSMQEMIHEEADTEGKGGKETGTGETAQADGRKTGDVNPPGDGSHDASIPAQGQQGTSQLVTPISEAIDQVADMGSVDPMNTAVIDYIDDGMSKVEASNAAAKDQTMMEAVFGREFKKHMIPILKKMASSMSNASEAIVAVDGKVEASKPALEINDGFRETVMQSVPVGVTPQTNRIDEKSLEETRSEITQKYLSDDSPYS